MENFYSVFTVADWFLAKVICDQKKLQKLCYYAQSWSLAMRNRKIMNAEFEAWVHGPVNRELWKKCREFGFSIIPSDYLKEYHKDIDEDNEAFLERVLKTYGGFSGYDLECLTHTETPWLNARAGYGEAERCYVVISESDMRDYYRSMTVGDGLGE